MSDTVFGGLATGIGSWPGTDVREAAGIVLGELPALPHVVELPSRGLGADLIGRTGALMVDVELDVRTSGYRVAQRKTRAGRRAEDLLHEDLDVLEELWETGGFASSLPVLKAQVAGPFTMAAQVELRSAHRVLTDRGAVRDFAESLAEGIREHVAELKSRLGVDVVVQLDEPSLPAVLRGSLSGVSRLDPVPAYPEPDALELLDFVVASIGVPAMVHCCASGVPIDLIRRSRAEALAIDVTLLGPRDLDSIGEFLQAGKTLVLGVVPGTAPERIPTWREAAAPVVSLIDRLGFAKSVLATQISVSPACGLAGATPEWARTASTLTKNVADSFRD
ncbi:methionine synthase [Rhodococcoides kyotonense]|uniref:Cobalamin-independent synthase, Catalytic domain n=1 Tax=Rhodococcoides kyotonense TaxID=398843 RepID=A0A239DI51_9NOCA|nr:methionine synthase [Rhodococcus kyotonensis]SNS31413.1 Cobalamin-independent synthase, Catalytic domain [Rhodococcus kyotonensis]